MDSIADGPSPLQVPLEVGRFIAQRGRRALHLLLEARDYAAASTANQWDYALDLGTMMRRGLSPNDLRWMIYNELLLRSDEVPSPDRTVRRFRLGGPGGFRRSSCFVLTDAGANFAQLMLSLEAPTLVQQACLAPAADRRAGADRPEDFKRDPLAPVWDRDRLELRFGSSLVKRFKAPAPNQELVLAVFQEEGWPPHIDDPLPPHPEQDARRRLHDTINSLNRNQKAPLIRFLGDGKGQGVRWELAHREDTFRRAGSAARSA